jgi:hypothetical protein
MKKTLLFLILLPLATLSQNYSNFSQSIVLADLTTASTGGAGGSISITNNTLTANFSGGWPSSPMKIGIIKYLAISPVITYLELGPLMNSTKTAQTGYFAKIENNNLVFYTSGSSPLITGCSINFTKSFSQNVTLGKIKFEYDSEGNQIKRTYCNGCTGKKQLAKNDVIQAEIVMEDHVSYSPNPVIQELNLSWELADNKTVTNIQVYSSSGQLIKTYTASNILNNQTISFQDCPAGLYLIVLTYDNAEKRTIKIIKK